MATPEKQDNQRNNPNPGKPNNDPDQTPKREVHNPPVADPAKRNDPSKTQNEPAKTANPKK
jgi:hypothetical protein